MKLNELVFNFTTYQEFLNSIPKEEYRIGDFLIEKIPPAWFEQLVSHAGSIQSGVKLFREFSSTISNLIKHGGEIYGVSFDNSIAPQHYLDYLNAVENVEYLWRENLKVDKRSFKNIELLKVKIEPNNIDVIATIRQFIQTPTKKIIFLETDGEIVGRNEFNILKHS